jgi:hypothetical protein
MDRQARYVASINVKRGLVLSLLEAATFFSYEESVDAADVKRLGELRRSG